VRFENGQLAKDWDVIEDEATKEAAGSGRPHVRRRVSVFVSRPTEAVSDAHRRDGPSSADEESENE
jgi:hypothetical protein